MAESIFNKLTKKHSATSAGVDPGKWEGKKLTETIYVLPSLKEIDIDVSENVSKKIKKQDVELADKIVVIGVEKEKWPDYLKDSNRTEYWDIKDPANGDMNVHRMTRDQIKEKVKKLIEKLR
mgnify:CR=1 FL=1